MWPFSHKNNIMKKCALSIGNGTACDIIRPERTKAQYNEIILTMRMKEKEKESEVLQTRKGQ